MGFNEISFLDFAEPFPEDALWELEMMFEAEEDWEDDLPDGYFFCVNVADLHQDIF